MEKGKFSQPRPYRDEERKIEEAFRQVTGQAPAAKPEPVPEIPLSEEFDLLTEMEIPLPEEQPVPEKECYPDEEPEYVPVSFLDTVLDFCSRNQKAVMISLCAVALALIIGVIAIFAVSTSDPYKDKILNNVMIADVNVGGMTKSEAITAVKYATGSTYSKEDMVVDLAGTLLSFSPEDTGVSLNVEAAVEAAYAYGRTGTKEEQEKAYADSLTGNHTIGLLPYLELDTAYILQELTHYAEDTGSTLTQATYGLEGRQPQLQVDKFDEDEDPQVLVLVMGTPGISFDAEAVFDQILDAYSLHRFLVTVDDVTPVVEPDPVDLEAIFQEFYIPPQDAKVDLQTFEVIPGAYGYGFDIAAAQKMVDAAGYGEELRIPMEFIEPALVDEDEFFRDVLGACETPHSNNDNRTNNLRLACKALDGLVLNPGQTFSFNNAVGERTAAKGYKPAPAYVGNELVDSVGGGVCQISSTLYYCTLLSDLEIVARSNHGFPVSYIDMGMDATVSWGGPDFKFRNNTNYPIKIEAEVSNGYVRMQILGIDERDYYVEMEYQIANTYKPETEYRDFEYDNEEGYKDGDVIEKGTAGYLVKTYKVKYDKETGDRISREFEANSRYTTLNRVVARVEAPEETEPSTEAPTEPPTEPPTTAPPETEPEETQPVTTPPETEPAPTQPREPDPTEGQTDPPPASETEPNA